MVKIKRKLSANKGDVALKTSLKKQPKRKALQGRVSLTLRSPNKVLLLKRKVLKSPKKTAKWHTLIKEKVMSCVKALLRLKAQKHSASEILLDERQPIYMVVQCVRIPKMQTKNFRFLLPHPVVDDESDICLFVPDLKKGRNVDHEPTVEHYKELLRANQIKGISEIIPMRQLKVEYDQYELRRQLISRFDLFLSDGRISGHIHHLLGKEAYRRRKLPVPVDMKTKHLKLEFDRAKSKVLMMMKGTGDKAALKVGHTKQKVEDIVENIMEVANHLGRQYPGGWNNIQSLHIHVQDSKLIPIYVSLKPRNKVKVPEVKYIVPKKAVPVEGELSTFPGTKVIVLPSGEVIVKKEKSEEDAEMGSDWDEYDSGMEIDLNDEENLEVEKKQEKIPEVKLEQPPKDEKDSESEDEEEENEKKGEEDDFEEKTVEDAENAYLNQWHKEMISKIESKAKEEENKKDDAKKPNKKKTSKRKVLDKVAQEIPKKKIKMLKSSQVSNKKVLAKQKSKAVAEESEKNKTKTEVRKQNIKKPIFPTSKKTMKKSSLKKQINMDVKKDKKKKNNLNPKRLSALTEVGTSLQSTPNEKMMKRSKKITDLNRQGLKSKKSTLKKPLSSSKKATMDNCHLSKKDQLKKTLSKKYTNV